MMIEVFKTNIQDSCNAKDVIAHLQTHFNELKFTMDLDDCDRILRVVGKSIDIGKIIEHVSNFNYSCSVLD